MWDGNNLVYINPSLSEYLLTGFTAYYGLGIFESNQNGTKYRYQRNAHGDTTALLNQSGDIVRCYTYEDAFGTSTYSADDTNPFRYAGQYYDRESQSYYLRARSYLPRYGRFSQQDTHWNTGNMLYGDNPVTLNGRQIPNYAAISQGLNLYTYCADNPVHYRDDNGDSFTTAFVGCIAAGITVGIINQFRGGSFIAGFADGFISSATTCVAALLGPIGVVVGSSIGSAIGSCVSNLIDGERNQEVLIHDAAVSAATGILSGLSSLYWDCAVDMAKEAGSAAQKLMDFDKELGEAIKLFFDEVITILCSAEDN